MDGSDVYDFFICQQYDFIKYTSALLWFRDYADCILRISVKWIFITINVEAKASEAA